MDKIVEREINGILYKARFKGMACKFALESKINSKKSDYQVAEILFNDILVSPKVDIDDFEDMDTFYDVYDFLMDVALGEYETPISNSKLRKQVEAEWNCWRLLCSDLGNFTYNDVFYQMTPYEIEKANIALDKVYTAIKSKTKK